MKTNIIFATVLMFFMINIVVGQEKYGILDEQAPEFNVTKWIDESGEETDISLSDFEDKAIVILCFQHWCPGCHSHAFPALNYLKDSFKRNPDVQFLAVQTVFEGKSINTLKKIRKTQKKYDLDIPFGHDDGSKQNLDYSAMMHNYKTGGTPWFIIIDRNGKVIYNNYDLEIQQGRRLIKKALEVNK